MWTGLFPVFMQATIAALGHRRSKPPYQVTSKKRHTGKKWPGILALLPQLAIIGGSLWTIIYGAFYATGPLDFRMLNCAWATWAIWTLSGIILAAVLQVRWVEEAPEPEWFSTGQIIQNIIALAFFIFMIILAAVMILKIAQKG
jgi:hypothetical protein